MTRRLFFSTALDPRNSLSGLPLVLLTGVLSVSLSIFLSLFLGCKTAPTTTPMTDVAHSAPAAPVLSPIEVPGSAFSLNGKPVKAIALPISGLARRPIPMNGSVVAYSSLKPGSTRWQVYSFDLTASTEQRRSFDAGNAEPVRWLYGRLLIASSTEREKQSAYILENYVRKFGSAATAITATSTATSAATTAGASATTAASPPDALSDLFFDRERISQKSAASWWVTTDSAQKQALVIGQDETATAFRIVVTQNGGHRVWVPTRPADSSLPPVRSAALTPDGQFIVWTFAKEPFVAITTNQGRQIRLLKIALTTAIEDPVVDPTGRWLIGSVSSQETGRNLIAIDLQSGCNIVLTELPGDERSPAFSADGAWLFFTLRQGELFNVSRIPFESADAGPACEQKSVANSAI